MKGRLEKVFMIVASVWGTLRILIARPRIIIFGTNAMTNRPYDPRMAKIYTWLDEYHISYAHLIRAMPGSNAISHWFRRRNPIIYFGTLPFLGRIFQASGAQQLWGIDDYRQWPLLVAVAHRAGLKTVIFQHGRFTRHQAGLAFPVQISPSLILPDVYIVWNEYWRDTLLSLSVPFAQHADRVWVGGKASQSITYSFTPHHHDQIITILWPYEPRAHAAEVNTYLKRLLNEPNIRVLYKIRKELSRSAQLERITPLLREHQRFEVIDAVTPEVLGRIDMVLGSYSTMLYELGEAGIPIGVMQMSTTQAASLIEDGTAQMIDHADPHMIDIVRRWAQVSDEQRWEQHRRMATTVDLRNTLSRLIQ